MCCLCELRELDELDHHMQEVPCVCARACFCVYTHVWARARHMRQDGQGAQECLTSHLHVCVGGVMPFAGGAKQVF